MKLIPHQDILQKRLKSCHAAQFPLPLREGLALSPCGVGVITVPVVEGDNGAMLQLARD
jgi:hypothetical protein